MQRSNFLDGSPKRHRTRPIALVGLLLVTGGLIGGPRLLADDDVGRIQVTRSQIESLPIWESILASDSRESFTIDVGSHFQDQTVTGVIELANDRRDPALIGSVQSSCGCTAAKRLQDEVKPQTSSPLLVQLRKTTAGEFEEELKFQFGSRLRHVLLKGKIVARISPSGPLVLDQESRGSIRLLVNDRTLIPQMIRFNTLSPELAVTRKTLPDESLELTFTPRLRETPLIEQIRLEAVLDGESTQALIIPVQQRGRVQVAPRRVYVRPEQSMRLFLFGDVDGVGNDVEEGTIELMCALRPLESADSAPINETQQTIPLAIQIDRLEAGLRLTSEEPFSDLPEGEYLVEATIGELQFQFEIFKWQ